MNELHKQRVRTAYLCASNLLPSCRGLTFSSTAITFFVSVRLPPNPLKALTDSSAAFDSYRKEIEQTRKELAKLTKEKATMQARYNKVNAALVVAHQEKSAVEEALRVAMAKTTALEGLCRALRQGQNAPSATEESACVTTDDVVVESAGGDEPSAQ